MKVSNNRISCVIKLNLFGYFPIVSQSDTNVSSFLPHGNYLKNL